ncbi:AraC family transcriptional regulator [Shewanella avicenniae]|uniref:AraC family transcriptional regulator n=1 Tax=Shewanella avicenniae TaxID=2814294 RepID=A0ABX7QL99_9GAMM|nr:AraC family transcriptional regulator [Shewanella avicenniae]QSX32044.1 AraC family transcriptional regulator [Shewanella avicenniae]
MPAATCHIQHRLLDTLPGIELVQAKYQGFRFDKHVHDDVHIGVVDMGVQRFMHKGQGYLLAPQRLSIINPDEVHDGHGANDDDYQVQLLRIPSATLNAFAQTMGRKPQETFLQGPEVNDPQLYQQLLSLHYSLQGQTSALALDTQLIAVLSTLVSRYAEQTNVAALTKLNKGTLAQLKDYLLADIGHSHRLADLSKLFDLSEHQFLRQFRREFGITPHAYLLALRVDVARQLIKTDLPLAEVASAAGFYDQSHLTHAFKRRYSLTPAEYQRQIRQRQFFTIPLC